MSTKPARFHSSLCGAAAIASLLVGSAAAVAQDPAQAAPLTAPPRGAAVVGDTWCMSVWEKQTVFFQQTIAQLLAIGGVMQGLDVSDAGGGYYALVCGKLPAKL